MCNCLRSRPCDGHAEETREAIRQIVRRSGIYQITIANSTGLHEDTVKRVLNGSNQSNDSLGKIANALGFDINNGYLEWQ